MADKSLATEDWPVKRSKPPPNERWVGHPAKLESRSSLS
jgi:hypothetical protein